MPARRCGRVNGRDYEAACAEFRHLIVRHLQEAAVEGADGAEAARGRQADDLVGFALEHGDRLA